MKDIQEIREELEKINQTTPLTTNLLPAARKPADFTWAPANRTIPRMPGQALPQAGSVIEDEITGRVSRVEGPELTLYKRHVGPDHHWGYNRITGKRIICNCGSTARDRIMHTIACPVWMTKDLVVYYPKNQEERKLPDYLETSRLYPCTTHLTSNCRVRGADRSKYCKNCLSAIGHVDRKEAHLGAVEQEQD